MGGTTVEILVRLGLSMGAIVGGLLVLRRWGRRPGRRVRGGITVEARTGLSKGASVAVVRVAGQRYLLGVTEHNVSVVAELEPDVDLDGPAEGFDDVLDDHQLDLRVDELAALPTGRATHDRSTWDVAGDGSDPGPRSGLVNRLQRMTLRSATSADRADIA